jgi:enterochelin esterase-like enzyme
MAHSRCFRWGWFLLAAGLLAGLIVACEPLAPEPTPVVIVLSSTPTRPPVPTATPPPTDTSTPPPPTETPTATPWVCTETQGQVLTLSFPSKIARTEVHYRVYLPPCYGSTTRRYPYVILMHGSDADHTEWTDQLNIQGALDTGLATKSLPPMILVMPEGGVLANTNVFRDGASWDNVVVNELMPEIEKNFCTWNTRDGRAIGGISRGGFWAFEIAFRRPDMFGAIGGHSPFFDPQIAPPAYNPLSLAKTVQFPPGLQPRIWVDTGKDDYARPNIDVFQKTLANRNIDPGYTMNPTGQHDVAYWAAHVSEYLAFYGQTWPRNVMDLPSCLQS